VALPTLAYALPTYYVIACAEVSSNLARYDGVAYGHRSSRAEGLYALYARTRAEGFGAEAKRRIMLGTFALSAGHYDGFYKRAQQVRTLVRRDFDRCFERVDLLATPVSPTPGFRIGEKVDDPLQMYLSDVYTIPVNLAGLPGISIPCGFDGGLPIGLQLIGRPFDEATILRAAHVYEQATEWHRRRPEIGVQRTDAGGRWAANRAVESRESRVESRRVGDQRSEIRDRISDIGYRISEGSPRTTDHGQRSTDVVIGLEIHVQLLTHSKMFCACSTRFAAPPNTQTCPVCLGLPGSLPVINRRAVELGLRTALALHCSVQPVSQFHRKNYYYPDLPKNYQISQYQYTGHPPLATDGFLEVEVDGDRRRIGIRRVHLEEDTAKLVHPEGADHSLVDYNRSGLPLMEIVTQPDLRSPAEAGAFLRALRQVLQYAEVSTGRMEEGTLRCDANVSLRRSDGELGTRTEVKNMNSIRSVERALAFEVARQREVLVGGGGVAQETRHWDERREVTFVSRTKEEAEDYRYFPEPDLVPIEVGPEWVTEVTSTLPEMPEARRDRFVASYGLGAHEANVLVQTREGADFFEAAVALHPSAKTIANWQIGEIAAYLNERNLQIEDLPITPGHLADLVRLIDEGTISGRIAKEVVPEMLSTGRKPAEIVAESGLLQIHDETALREVVRAVISDNPRAADDVRAGKERAIGALVGQVMKRTQGRANPAAVNRLLREELVNGEQ
jgi:aspartyl-tRNA(Asn)/glutamyl-tRNA(Gln) amidotransferase subunit B